MIVRLADKEHCTGCAGCKNVCPTGAIAMQPDGDGFFRPEVTAELCKTCHRCEQACPVLHPRSVGSRTPACYAVWAADEVRAQSSSGGVFSMLAAWIFSMGGVVYGVGVHGAEGRRFAFPFQRAERLEELAPLRGSKYVQADVGETYRQIQKDLDAGRQVLFTGTPCQVAALRSIVGEQPALYTVDCLCHGVPSQKMLQEFLTEKYPEVVDIHFRDKRLGWQANHTILKRADGAEFIVYGQLSAYKHLFLQNYGLQTACYDCPFGNIPRQGDVSMGDFWGIEQYKRDWNDGRGTSLLLVNTPRGAEMFAAVRNQAQRLEQVPLELAIQFNRLHAKISMPVERQHFFDLWRSGKYGFTQAVERAAKRQFDIGLVGNWQGRNFGAQLTYFALYSVLHDHLGYDVLMIERPLTKESEHFREQLFRVPPYPTYACEPFSGDYSRLFALNDRCDTFVLGSDQNWNSLGDYRMAKWASLDWVANNHRKIAYAASFGGNYIYPTYQKQAEMTYFFKQFDAISTREQEAADALAREYDIDAAHVLDPVFLCEKEKYVAVAKHSKNADENGHVFAYIFDVNDEKLQLVQQVAEKKGKSFTLIPDKWREEEFLRSTYGQYLERGASEEDWLARVINCSFMVTDSFHGMCFALIFHKPFIALLNKSRGADRFLSLAELFSMQERLLDSPQAAMQDIDRLLAQPVDWERFEARLTEEREHSLQWLMNALHTEKMSRLTSYDMLASTLTAHNEHIKHTQDYTYIEIPSTQTKSGRATRLFLGDQAFFLQVTEGNRLLYQSPVSMKVDVQALERRVQELEKQVADLKGGQETLQGQLSTAQSRLHTLWQAAEGMVHGAWLAQLQEMLDRK